MGDWREALDRAIEDRADRLRDVRRHLHANPELSGHEAETAKFLGQRLAESGVPYTLTRSAHGILAGSVEGSATPVVAFRADIDALPIQDAKDVPYRSSRRNVMHGCGHDAHSAMALGAAEALWTIRDRLPVKAAWRAVFQPAEEIGRGALEMVKEGAMEGVKAITALHVDPTRAVGRVGARPHMLTAFCHDLRVVVHGQGGHAARPHLARDPLHAAAQFISMVYQAIPRSVNAHDPTVVTFGRFQAGVNANVIPAKAVLKGTIRTLSRESAQRVTERLNQIAKALGAATGTRISVRSRNSTDGVFNDPRVTAVCTRTIAEVVGVDHLDEIPEPSMGAEDFSGYLSKAPGCMVRLGVGRDDGPVHHLHSPMFDIDERALVIGAKILARCTVRLSEEFSNDQGRS